MPGCDFCAAIAEDQRGLGIGDGVAGGAGSNLCGRVAFSHHCFAVICIVAFDAFVDCRADVACGGESSPGFECETSGLAGQDQLQPLLVAAVVCVWERSSALVFCGVCGGTG